MREYRFVLAFLLIVSGTGVMPAAVGQFGFLKGGSKTDFQLFTDPGGRFALEYPKDWQVIAGAGDVLVTFAQKKSEAAFVVERYRMSQALAPDEITDLFAQIEADVLKERQPKAVEVAAKIVHASGQRLIVIDYSRPGLSGPERARQYSFPVGQDLYRLTCSAVRAQFAKYDPVFIHLAETFKPAEVAR